MTLIFVMLMVWEKNKELVWLDIFTEWDFHWAFSKISGGLLPEGKLCFNHFGCKCVVACGIYLIKLLIV